MLTVEDFAKIRRAHRDGMSIREIARRFHHSRRKIREALRHAEPRPYTRHKARPAPKLDPFKGIIDEILKSDEDAPRKQRHTAAQIFRRLQGEHDYQGGYDQVRRYVASQRRIDRETFLPLDDDPGQRLEADFGEIHVEFPGGRRAVSVLLLTWAGTAHRVVRTGRLPWRFPRSAWKPSFTGCGWAWSSSVAFPKKCGGTIPRPSLLQS